jgi:hypothetical protein
LVFLVDFAHTWSEAWVAKYEQTQSRFWYCIKLWDGIDLFT